MLISECISVEVFQKNKAIYGVGNEIRIAEESKEITLPWKFPRKIHGIRTEENGRILCFGERHFMLISLINGTYLLMCTGKISDWISGGTLCADNSFCLVTAHSVALRFKCHSEEKVPKILEKCSCEDKSTLYCSFLMGKEWDDLIVFGGNAFGELIIWQPKSTLSYSRSPVLHRLSAHQGVVFSINVNLEFNMMTTTSDDRSVRFWNLSLLNENNKVDWVKSNLVPYRSSYGHTARVFQAKIIQQNNQPFVISCGEDSSICLWNSNGELLHKIKRQFGSVLDFCYDCSTKTIFASTSSGNIIKYGISDHFISSYVQEIQLANGSEYLAKVKFSGISNIIGITNRNNLVAKKLGGEWKFLGKRFSYKCTVFEVFGKLVSTAGYKTVSLYNFNDELLELEKIFEADIMNNIIRSLFIFSENEFLISDDSGMCKFSSDCFNTSMKFDVPQSKERWVTSALKIDDFLIVSNRQGNIFLYCLENGSMHLKSTIKHIHGYLGVKHMLLEKRLGESCIFRTCGHDGTVKTILLDKITNNIKVVYTENVPVSWVEKLEKSEKGDNFVLGFNDNHFVLWQKMFDFLLQLPCGGGHRCWDYQLDGKNNKISVIYIKNRRLYLYHGPLKNMSKSRIAVNHHYWHFKICNVLKIIPVDSLTLILISGGEDNLLKFSRYNLKNSKFEVISEMFLHISSIKAIEIVKLSKDFCLIFSAGGRAQICISQFNLKEFSIEEKSNFMLKSNDFDRKYIRNTQDIDFDPETRIMALIILPSNNKDSYDIFAGCSDGFIRKFIYKNNEIIFCTEVFYNKCILHLRLIKVFEKNILVSCATDGVLCFWDIDKFSNSSVPIFQHRHHESGINSVDIKIDNDHLFIATGGDDQSVVISEIKYSKDLFYVTEKKTINSLHIAQVNGIKISNCKKFLYSVGVDQHICTFDLSNFSLNKKIFSCVADSKGLELWNFSDNRNICIVYGCGVQILEL